jgi:hypothetical protein
LFPELSNVETASSRFTLQARDWKSRLLLVALDNPVQYRMLIVAQRRLVTSAPKSRIE